MIAEVVRTSLGPRGMDKMLVDGMGDVTITNDGATMLKDMDVQHPAARMIIEIAKTMDDEVGDGTTLAVVFAGAPLQNAENLMERGVHPVIIASGYTKAAHQAQKNTGQNIRASRTPGQGHPRKDSENQHGFKALVELES